MIILDTNVLSELMREKPELKIVNWVDQQPRSSIWITSITYLEIVLGIETMSGGKRQTRLKKSPNLLGLIYTILISIKFRKAKTYREGVPPALSLYDIVKPVGGCNMAQFVVRNLEDDVKKRLKRRAELHGRSMEEEVREILRTAVNSDLGSKPSKGLGTEIALLFRTAGIKEAIPELHGHEIQIPEFD
jgi:antitoxin FitA